MTAVAREMLTLAQKMARAFPNAKDHRWRSVSMAMTLREVELAEIALRDYALRANGKVTDRIV
jgi:hypothetical protein